MPRQQHDQKAPLKPRAGGNARSRMLVLRTLISRSVMAVLRLALTPEQADQPRALPGLPTESRCIDESVMARTPSCPSSTEVTPLFAHISVRHQDTLLGELCHMGHYAVTCKT